MIVPQKFDAIRPVEPEELQAEMKKLFDDAQFQEVVAQIPGLVGVPFDGGIWNKVIASCQTNLDFQKGIIYPIVKSLAERLTNSLTIDATAVPDKSQPYTFISNHRDIVLDSAFLALLLIDDGFPDTVEIAIGDNLLAYPWIERLVRINKAFIVRRGLSLRETLKASGLLSEYMHFSITMKRQNIWIAQREGRAKDSNDRTQEALLKMMCMAGEGSPADRIRELRLTPLAISYEYDPCDYLKAKEFQLKRDDANYKKARQDDLDNMKAGIFGFKGRVHYHIAQPLNAWLDANADLPKSDFFSALAQHIDTEIHRHYKLFPINYIAMDLLDGTHSDNYTDNERSQFENYVDQRVALVDLPQPDETFLRERILTMYANPARNYLSAHSTATV